MITQPFIAVAFCPEGTADAEYSRHVAGLTALKNSDGAWSVLLDKPITADRLIVLATIVKAAAARASIIVSLDGTDTDGNVRGFDITTLDNAGAALDTGFMLGVSVIPDLD